MKPWAKYEQNYINHPKFLALTANAICLWLEGKNYCDMHQTDGYIPKSALKTFRFSSKKSLKLLTFSIGDKQTGEPWAALWEEPDLPVGFYRMHDYLEHNDCRDEVLQRIEDADDIAKLRRLSNKQRQQKYRAERKARIVEECHTNRNAVTCDVTRTCSPPTETATETETDKKKEREERVSLSAVPPADRKRDPFTDPSTADRAAGFIDRYQALYAKHRKGARYAVRPARDYAAAVTLCDTWPDDSRLDKLATIFLLTDHKFAEEGSRTIPQFLGLASWCDGKLAEHEAKQGVA